MSHLGVAYGPVAAVHDVSLEVTTGSITAIIGANGAGKTTVMRALAGLLPQATGQATMDGVQLLGLRANVVVGHGIALVPEGRRLFASMTVRENLVLGAYRRRGQRAAIARALEQTLERLPVLKDRLPEPARALSGGQQQMLAIGRALMSGPRLLMLDEPSVGLSPQMVHAVGEILRGINAEGVDVLLVEQNASLALGVATYGFVMESGRVVLHGPAHVLAGDRRVREAYLGLDEEQHGKEGGA